MESFIFGTFATDDLKLIYHRASHSGVQHGYDLDPRDPQPGQLVTVNVLLGPDQPADHVVCYYTTDGSEPEGSRGQASRGETVPLQRIATEWDTVRWGYVTRWAGVLPGQPEGTTVRYRIGAWREGGEEVFADWPAVKATQELAARAFFRGDPTLEMRPMGNPRVGQLFNYHVDRLAPPRWAREAVIYHIFVDRFFPGEGRDWLQTSDLRAPMGGTLWGVAEKMDYFAELGVNCLWLSPIFPSPTVHGYDATDYTRIEPRLGGDEALRAVVEEAHTRAIRVILDMTCNHVSNQHPIFKDALANPRSPYRSWFHFNDEDIGYRTFFGVPSMPQVNLADPGAREWMLDIARYWLREFRVDGYRLDHANGPGPGFWSDFWAACKAENPECFVFAEIVEPPEVLRQYVGRMDGALDFHLTDALQRTFAAGEWSREMFDHFLERHFDYWRGDDFLLLTFLDNHDMDRFLHIAGNNKEALKQAAAVQMSLPGPPVIYYGTEVGVTQEHGRGEKVGLEASRGPMRWGDERDTDLLYYYWELIQERRKVKPWLHAERARPSGVTGSQT